MSQPKFTPWHAHKYPDVKTWTVAGANGSVASKIKDAETAALIACAPEMYEALETQIKTLQILLEFFATRPFVPSRQVWADQYADDMRAERNEMLTLLARAKEGE